MAKSRVGEELYEAIFHQYTVKQWAKDPARSHFDRPFCFAARVFCTVRALQEALEVLFDMVVSGCMQLVTYSIFATIWVCQIQYLAPWKSPVLWRAVGERP